MLSTNARVRRAVSPYRKDVVSLRRAGNDACWREKIPPFRRSEADSRDRPEAQLFPLASPLGAIGGGTLRLHHTRMTHNQDDESCKADKLYGQQGKTHGHKAVGLHMTHVDQ